MSLQKATKTIETAEGLPKGRFSRSDTAGLGRSDKPKGPTVGWNKCFLKHTKNSMKKQKNRKNNDAKMKSWKLCDFWNMTRFLPKDGGLNGWAIIGVLLKSIEFFLQK